MTIIFILKTTSTNLIYIFKIYPQLMINFGFDFKCMLILAVEDQLTKLHNAQGSQFITQGSMYEFS